MNKQITTDNMKKRKIRELVTAGLIASNALSASAEKRPNINEQDGKNIITTEQVTEYKKHAFTTFGEGAILFFPEESIEINPDLKYQQPNIDFKKFKPLTLKNDKTISQSKMENLISTFPYAHMITAVEVAPQRDTSDRIKTNRKTSSPASVIPRYNQDTGRISEIRMQFSDTKINTYPNNFIHDHLPHEFGHIYALLALQHASDNERTEILTMTEARLSSNDQYTDDGYVGVIDTGDEEKTAALRTHEYMAEILSKYLREPIEDKLPSGHKETPLADADAELCEKILSILGISPEEIIKIAHTRDKIRKSFRRRISLSASQ